MSEMIWLSIYSINLYYSFREFTTTYFTGAFIVF